MTQTGGGETVFFDLAYAAGTQVSVNSALRVRGDSMIEDHIVDGDVVLLEARKQPRNGETVVALIRREDVTLKRFQLDGPVVTLIPANSALAPMRFPAEDVEVQGVVVGLLRDY